MSSIRKSMESQQQLLESLPLDPISPGFNTQRHLAREVLERRDQYTKAKKLRLKIGSWNVGANADTEKDIEGWFVAGKALSKLHGGLATGSKVEENGTEDVGKQEETSSKKSSTIPENDTTQLPSHEDIDIYVLGLQEIVDINSAAEALKPFNDAVPAKRWKDAVENGLPQGYTLVAEQQLLGLLLLVYASPSITPTISSVSTSSVGTGLMGYMGNKGGVSVRIMLGETTKIVFVNSHLAAGNDKASLERRNWDASQIVQRTKFAPVDHGHGVIDEIGDQIGDEDFAFWFGDLNYRLADIPDRDVRRLLLLHTRNEYDQDDATRGIIDKELNLKEDPNQEKAQPETESLEPSEDPASALTTISSLMTHDQLHAQMKLRNAFHEGWKEGPVQFLPTYKYDIGSVGMFDSSEKKRSPSWCDRILYRTGKHYKKWLQEKKEIEKSHKRDVEMKARGLEKDNGEDVIFDYDPETDGDDGNEAYTDAVSNRSEILEETDIDSCPKVDLEYYVSHQRVLSSDHKPLDAIFTLEYNAVDPELKSKVYSEVAKEIDRQENEGRPSVTAIFESSDLHEKSEGCQFGDLRFLQEKVILLTVANTSPVPATIEFLGLHPRPQTDRSKLAYYIAPISSWLRIIEFQEAVDRRDEEPLKIITLQPGETLNLKVIAMVSDHKDLTKFNSGAAKPEGVIVMRVHNGRDHFIAVQANWLPSCFGRSLDELIRLGNEGVRSQSAQDSTNKLGSRRSAPKELFRLTEAIEEAFLELHSNEEVFNEMVSEHYPGWPFTGGSSFGAKDDTARDSRQVAIRDALDTASTFDLSGFRIKERLKILIDMFEMLLQYMPAKVVSAELWETLSASLIAREASNGIMQGEEFRTHVLDVLSTSPSASVSFTIITFMAARIFKELSAVLRVTNDQKDDSMGSDIPQTPRTSRSLFGFKRAFSSRADNQAKTKADKTQEWKDSYILMFKRLLFEVDINAGRELWRMWDEQKKLVIDAFLTI